MSNTTSLAITRNLFIESCGSLNVADGFGSFHGWEYRPRCVTTCSYDQDRTMKGRNTGDSGHMKTLFTVHAGEFLVGSEIEKRIPKASVWLPSKDTGIDLLVTNSRNTRAVTLQVKYSRDFVPRMESELTQGLRASGWWTYRRKKLRASKADLWAFVLPSFEYKETHYLLITPKELDRRVLAIHGKQTLYQSYFCVTEKRRCWDARGLLKEGPHSHRKRRLH